MFKIFFHVKVNKNLIVYFICMDFKKYLTKIIIRYNCTPLPKRFSETLTFWNYFLKRFWNNKNEYKAARCLLDKFFVDENHKTFKNIYFMIILVPHIHIKSVKLVETFHFTSVPPQPTILKIAPDGTCYLLNPMDRTRFLNILMGLSSLRRPKSL